MGQQGEWLRGMPKGAGRIVRPYAITGGRVRSGSDLPLETLIEIIDGTGGAVARLTLERRAIAELASQPISVAEISALLEVPLGVARVLVGDMAIEGLIRVYRPREERPDILLLEKVLDGIRAL